MPVRAKAQNLRPSFRTPAVSSSAVQNLLIFEGHDGTQRANLIGQITDWGFTDGPVHAGFTCPDIDGLLGWELVAEFMPGGIADVGHLLNEMCHGDCFQKVE